MENHNFENEVQFNRQMNSRHLQMLSIGGVIGTGLFLSSGYAINQAGPFGAILSYLFGGVMVYLVMFSLGELSVAMPVTGSFHTYATRFISPGTGFMVAWKQRRWWNCWQRNFQRRRPTYPLPYKRQTGFQMEQAWRLSRTW